MLQTRVAPLADRPQTTDPLGCASLTDQKRESSVVWVIATGIAVLFLWARVVVTIKRWHDLDQSGWWVLIALVPVIGEVWTIYRCGIVMGSDGENAYGPDPLVAVRR